MLVKRDDCMTLGDARIGEKVKIIAIGGENVLRHHFFDMGFIPGAEVTVVKYAPLGDPIELRIHDCELTLRLNDAQNITVEPVTEDNESKLNRSDARDCILKGVAEGNIYRKRTEHKPASKNAKLTFALVGNQNSGKTTLFNQLTGSNQHVGNFPGVTVDKKTGVIKGRPNTEITDLPGIYSMSPYSSEEIVTREFIIDEKPMCIINVVDATNLERNLYLTMQLMELDVPMVLALNMMDEVKGNGGNVDTKFIEELLGIPVIAVSAAKNEGIDELIAHAVHIARYSKKPERIDFCLRDDNGGAVHKCLHSIMEILHNRDEKTDIPLRFAASKLVEGDKLISKKLRLTEEEDSEIKEIIKVLEKERGLEAAAAMADMRFSFINRLVLCTVKKPGKSREHERSFRIDKILTGKYTAIPVFIMIMAIVFYLTFNVIGAWLQGLLESGIDLIISGTAAAFDLWNINPVVKSLVIDGVFTGVGSVLSFLPIIVVLFFFLSILEDSGYIARVAFVMDKLLRKIGLSGRSIVPMLIGFGCTVPAVMASRTIPSERDKKMTILLTPFMGCTAKLPVYTFFTAMFFPKHSGLVIITLYLIGIVVGLISTLILNKTIFKGESVPFVMELPNYRMPGAKNVLLLMWDKAKDFLGRAFSVIFVASIVVWCLQTFDFSLHMAETPEKSILASVAGVITPIFKPLGFGDWRICTSLAAGFMAKESVVSTLSVLCGTGVSTLLSGATVWALLVFCLLYTPCIAAVSSIRRELGGRWAAIVVVEQCAVAWVCAFITKILAEIVLF